MAIELRKTRFDAGDAEIEKRWTKVQSDATE